MSTPKITPSMILSFDRVIPEGCEAGPVAEILDDTRLEAIAAAVTADLSMDRRQGELGDRVLSQGSPAEVAVAIGDDAFVQALNHQFRQIDRPTNVLSFPASDHAAMAAAVDTSASVFLGDLALASGFIAREAEALNVSLANHAIHMIVHGTLHLLGYDHIDDEDAGRMESLETRILARMGIDDPYKLP